MYPSCHNGEGPPPRHIAPGSRLDARYRILRDLGSGSMGRVWLARDERRDRVVALKIVAGDHAERLAAEARAMAQVNHRNVVRLEGLAADSDPPYFVMEYVDGVGLDQLIAPRRRFDPETVLVLLDEVARGLCAIHATGLVHGDVKPSNVLVAGDRAVVTDFGLVDAAQGAVAGTPLYIAPEVVMRRAVPTRYRSARDQYALGIVGYQLLTGVLPFSASNTDVLLMQHALDTPEPIRSHRPELPAVFDLVFGRALAKEPVARYDSCRDMVENLVRAWTTTRSPLAPREAVLARWLAPTRAS